MSNKQKPQRQVFDPNNVPLEGSLGLLALGDIGFEAWRKAKQQHNIEKRNEKK